MSSFLEVFSSDEDFNILNQALRNYASQLENRIKIQYRAPSCKGHDKIRVNELKLERVKQLLEQLPEEFI